MSINWVMLPDPPSPTRPFIPLPNERTLFTSNPRTSLALSTSKSTYPAHAAGNLNISSSDGTIYLTNQRIIYLPRSNSSISSNMAPKFESFSCPLLNLHDTHLVMPWFGPNAWTALVQPVPGGNMYASSTTAAAAAAIELKLTFKEGGAPDFQGRFEAVKERLQQVVEEARSRNVPGSRNTGSGQIGLDMANVHLDQLPSYQEHDRDRIAEQSPPSQQQQPQSPQAHSNPQLDSQSQRQRQEIDEDGDSEMLRIPENATADEVRALAAAAATRRAQQQQEQQRAVAARQRSIGETEELAEQTPDEAPPGYEETQRQVVNEELAGRLHQL